MREGDGRGLQVEGAVRGFALEGAAGVVEEVAFIATARGSWVRVWV